MDLISEVGAMPVGKPRVVPLTDRQYGMATGGGEIPENLLLSKPDRADAFVIGTTAERRRGRSLPRETESLVESGTLSSKEIHEHLLSLVRQSINI